MDELTKEFLVESQEGLDRMERCLTELEARPSDQELLSEIFRAVHTIKGTTGFLGFVRLGALAHTGENLLGKLRDGLLVADAGMITVLLRLLDGLRGILLLIEATGTEGSRATDEDGALIEMLETMQAGGAAALTQDGGLAREEGPAAVDPSSEVSPDPAEAARSAAVVSAAAPSIKAQPMAESGMRSDTLRIDVAVLNRLMNLVGELVLTRNQMLQVTVDQESFPRLTRRLDSVTVELREAVMQARMQPVGHVFAKFPRLVRDLARECDRQVRLEFQGQETGLDKSLLEAIKDPLTHAVRNAVDHGIEAPSVRAKAGKPVEGVVRLRAFHEGGSVVIEVSDDGAGIAVGRVLAKAIERHLITETQAAGMSEREAMQLVFSPGFSTRENVTQVSGRGVGMDVVRANVEAAGGSVELLSKVGLGTTLRMRVPLTLAIVPALVVRSGEQSFCLPQSSLVELVLVPERERAQAFERIGAAEVYRLRGHLLPLVWLDRVLDLAPSQASVNEQGSADEHAHGVYLAVLEAEGCRFGLVVDDLLAPEEIVVKPLSAALRQIGLFSGATVLGSGALALILDTAAVAARAGVRPVEEASHAAAGEDAPALGDARLLVFEVEIETKADGSNAGPTGGGKDGSVGLRFERMAMPLEMLERIESVAPEEIEYAAGRAMLQYRGAMLPLEDAEGRPRGFRSGEQGALTVLICRRGARRVGVVVRQVLDVADGRVLSEESNSGEAPLALVKERLTRMHLNRFAADTWKLEVGGAKSALLREVA